MNELARLTGIQKADLSRIEAGRINPTGEEFERVMAILDGIAVKDPAEPRLAEPAGSPT